MLEYCTRRGGAEEEEGRREERWRRGGKKAKNEVTMEGRTRKDVEQERK